MFTMKNKWILFSYSIPAANAKARMRTWRRISATGAAQLKTGLQILPYREDLQENITWLIGEVTALGGEAIALQCARVEGMTEQQIEQLFQAQVDPEFEQIQAEARTLLATADTLGDGVSVKELSTALRKLRKKCEAVRERDFFPSGAAAKTMKSLDAISERLRRPDQTDLPAARVDRADYQGRTWVTRARPYIDRLGSAWLIRRFIDPQARFRFLLPGEHANLHQGELPFDMAMGDFTHQGELITFEVLLRDFALHDQALAKIGELVKCIDVQEGALTEDAALLKILLDGLAGLTADDHQLLDRALLLFDALHAGYARTVQGEAP
ncbi:MAG: chromate resistance protein [Desulfobulbaceae bacterium]|nr:MAG: chromate resistance protein [Desulfobulbaceae bacterium]